MSDSTIRKEKAGAPEGFFQAEAAGLRWLAAADGARVAGVVEVGDGFIDLERIAEGSASAAAAEAFGRDLATTHAAGADAFGAPPEGWGGPCYIGRIGLPVGCYEHWGEFYAELRVRPYAENARRIGNLDDAGFGAVEAVCDRLVGGEFDDSLPPARIHGDLWTGNLLFTPDGTAMIDPAAHGGHGLTDLAMLALFGAPHLKRILDSYAEAAGLASSVGADWRELIGLHQLHPLLVHAVTHGPSFGAEAARIAQRY